MWEISDVVPFCCWEKEHISALLNKPQQTATGNSLLSVFSFIFLLHWWPQNEFSLDHSIKKKCYWHILTPQWLDIPRIFSVHAVCMAENSEPGFIKKRLRRRGSLQSGTSVPLAVSWMFIPEAFAGSALLAALANDLGAGLWCSALYQTCLTRCLSRTKTHNLLCSLTFFPYLCPSNVYTFLF